MKRILLLLVICSIQRISIAAQTSSAIDLIREFRKIHTPNGVEKTCLVELNGDKQWINVRGKDSNNPVMLFVHGGPASPTMPIAWAYQSPWEDFFTVVQWDQRMAGKNWLIADTSQAATLLNFENIVSDGIALVDTLCKTLKKEKIIIMGYSFGSKIGMEIAKRVPEKIYAYIGVGQMTNMNPEKFLYERLLQLSAENADSLAQKELLNIAPYPNPNGSTPVRKLLLARKWARKYNGGWYGKPDFDLLFNLPSLSPDYTSSEIESLGYSTSWLTRKIMAGPKKNTSLPENLEVPVFFFMGKHDLHTPYEPSQIYFNQLTAPLKKFITFEYSAHVPMMEEPGKFLLALVNEVLPIIK